MRPGVQIEDGVAEVIAERDADRSVLGKHQDTLVLIRKTKLPFGADHPCGFDAANRARFEDRRLTGVSIDELGTDFCKGDFLSGGEVGSAADDRFGPGSGIYRREAQPIGVRMRGDVDHQSNRDVVPGTTNLLDRFDLGDRQRQTACEVLHREGDVHEFREPLQRNLHKTPDPVSCPSSSPARVQNCRGTGDHWHRDAGCRRYQASAGPDVRYQFQRQTR